MVTGSTVLPAGVPTGETSHRLGLAQTSGETEAPLGGGDGGQGWVAGQGWRGTHAGHWWSGSTSCEDSAPGSGRLISPSILTQAPRGRPFCAPHFTGRGQTRGSDGRTLSRLACSPRQHLAGMTAALGSQRNELPSFPPPRAQVLARLLFIIFTWELSLWRGLVSAETRGVEPNGLRPGPALSRRQGWGLRGWMSSQPRPPASCREKEVSSARCRGLGSRNGRMFLAPVSLLGSEDQPGRGSRGEGALSSQRAGAVVLPLMLSVWMCPQSRPRPASALELRHPHLRGGQEGPRNLFC